MVVEFQIIFQHVIVNKYSEHLLCFDYINFFNFLIYNTSAY